MHPSIQALAEVCVRHGITNAVCCPGSRSAPLTLAFLRNPGIVTRTFSDERSAAFVAMGMSHASQKPVVLISTSGTAAFNFAPAVAEACFLEVPLIVITADRPREWVGQLDGQTIYQEHLYGRHVKQFFELPQEYGHQDDQWAVNRMINDAINLSKETPCGPVHINVPLREPLYPTPGTPTEPLTGGNRSIHTTQEIATLSDDTCRQLFQEWQTFNRILVVAGQGDFDPRLQHAVAALNHHRHVPVVGDITSNLHPVEGVVRYADLFLGQAAGEVKDSLQPDLLITFGKGLVAKNLKLFLRQHSPRAHWHLQPAGPAADTFRSLTRIVRTVPAAFFEWVARQVTDESFESQRQQNYGKLWEIEERRIARQLSSFFPCEPLGEFELVHEIIEHLPPGTNLHLANSMSVRYASFNGLSAAQETVKIFSNRGTSGIDGCTSTAIGHALVNDALHVLITGDMAFFYDRNAFWHNYPLSNFRVVVLNNHGGTIFGMIDGPSTLPEAAEYFITRQPLNARKLCEEFGFEYYAIDNRRKVRNHLKAFFEPGELPKVLEIEGSMEHSKTIMDTFKAHIKNGYER